MAEAAALNPAQYRFESYLVYLWARRRIGISAGLRNQVNGGSNPPVPTLGWIKSVAYNPHKVPDLPLRASCLRSSNG